MVHTPTLLLVHAVFSTKERRPWLDPAVRADAFTYLGGIAREAGATALAVNGTVDHVHLPLAHPLTLALAELVRLLSVSPSTREVVIEYIARQEAHHQRMSFAEEYLALFKKHGVTFDERFVLD